MLTDLATRDHVEIGQLIARYGKALDDKDSELLGSVFTPAAALRYELEGRETRGSSAEWVGIFREFLAPFDWTAHRFEHSEEFDVWEKVLSPQEIASLFG